MEKAIELCDFSEKEKIKLHHVLHELDYEQNHMINFSDFITATMTHQEAKMTSSKV